MEIYKLIDARQKAFLIIESCETEKHLEVAQNYIERFKMVFGDLLSYSKLQLMINNKYNKLN